MKTVAIRDAAIRTLAVEVKALKIGPKQVTQSVFRQLIEENLVDLDTMQYRGVPWGWVNYRWGHCAFRGADHLHVAWQKDTDLRRACVDPEPSLGRMKARADERALAVEIGFLVAAMKPPRPEIPEVSRSWVAGGWRVSDKDWSEPIKDLLCRHYGRDPLSDHEVTKARAIINGHLQDLEYSGYPRPPFDEIAEPGRLARGLVDEIDARRRFLVGGWARIYRELTQLDQLFIAV